eukprot:RCo001471
MRPMGEVAILGNSRISRCFAFLRWSPPFYVPAPDSHIPTTPLRAVFFASLFVSVKSVLSHPMTSPAFPDNPHKRFSSLIFLRPSAPISPVFPGLSMSPHVLFAAHLPGRERAPVAALRLPGFCALPSKKLSLFPHPLLRASRLPQFSFFSATVCPDKLATIVTVQCFLFAVSLGPIVARTGRDTLSLSSLLAMSSPPLAPSHW